jgi:hypothetical protein
MHLPIRPKRVILATVIGLLILAVGSYLYHPTRVWLAHGEWCLTLGVDGQIESTRYGDECHR